MTNQGDPRVHMLTVSELIADLAKLPQDSVVILQCDAAGNGYSPLAGSEAAKYLPKDAVQGETPSNEDVGDYDEEDVAKMIDCVVLFPLH